MQLRNVLMHARNTITNVLRVTSEVTSVLASRQIHLSVYYTRNTGTQRNCTDLTDRQKHVIITAAMRQSVPHHILSTSVTKSHSSWPHSLQHCNTSRSLPSTLCPNKKVPLVFFSQKLYNNTNNNTTFV